MTLERSTTDLMYGDLATTLTLLQDSGEIEVQGPEQPLHLQVDPHVAVERLIWPFVAAKLADSEEVSRKFSAYLLNRVQNQCPAQPNRNANLVEQDPCGCLVKPYASMRFGAHSVPLAPTARTIMACAESKVLQPTYERYVEMFEAGKQVRTLCATQPFDAWQARRAQALGEMSAAHRRDAELFDTAEVLERELAAITKALREECSHAKLQYWEQSVERLGVPMALEPRLAAFEAAPRVRQGIEQAVLDLLQGVKASDSGSADGACLVTAGMLRDGARFERCIVGPMVAKYESDLRSMVQISAKQYEDPKRKLLAQHTFRAQAGLLIGAICSSVGLALTVVRVAIGALVRIGLTSVSDQALRPPLRVALAWTLVLCFAVLASRHAPTSAPPAYDGAQRSRIHEALIAAGQESPEHAGWQAWRVLSWWAYVTYTTTTHLEAIERRLFAAARMVSQTAVEAVPLADRAMPQDIRTSGIADAGGQ